MQEWKITSYKQLGKGAVFQLTHTCNCKWLIRVCQSPQSKAKQGKRSAQLTHLKNVPPIHNEHHILFFTYTCLTLHLPRRLFYPYKIEIKTLLPVRRSRVQKGKKERKNVTTMADLLATPPRSLFQAFTSVSGSSFAEEGYTDPKANWKILESPHP